MKKIKDLGNSTYYLLSFDDFYNIIAEFNTSTKNCEISDNECITKLRDNEGNIYNNIMIYGSGNADTKELKIKYCYGLDESTFVRIKERDTIVLILRKNDPSALTFNISRTSDDGTTVMNRTLVYHTVTVYSASNAEEVTLNCANYLNLLEESKITDTCLDKDGLVETFNKLASENRLLFVNEGDETLMKYKDKLKPWMRSSFAPTRQLITGVSIDDIDPENYVILKLETKDTKNNAFYHSILIHLRAFTRATFFIDNFSDNHFEDTQSYEWSPQSLFDCGIDEDTFNALVKESGSPTTHHFPKVELFILD